MKSFRISSMVGASLIFTLIASISGCGGASSTASGLVTSDGIPVGTGTVKFVSEADPKATPAVGAIKDGKYEVTADRSLKAGKYKVEITWSKNLPPMKAAPQKKVDPDITTVDPRQNTAENPTRTATMPAEVKAGANTIDFTLSSK